MDSRGIPTKPYNRMRSTWILGELSVAWLPGGVFMVSIVLALLGLNVATKGQAEHVTMRTQVVGDALGDGGVAALFFMAAFLVGLFALWFVSIRISVFREGLAVIRQYQDVVDAQANNGPTGSIDLSGLVVALEDRGFADESTQIKGIRDRIAPSDMDGGVYSPIGARSVALEAVVEQMPLETNILNKKRGEEPANESKGLQKDGSSAESVGESYRFPGRRECPTTNRSGPLHQYTESHHGHGSRLPIAIARVAQCSAA